MDDEDDDDDDKVADKHARVQVCTENGTRITSLAAAAKETRGAELEEEDCELVGATVRLPPNDDLAGAALIGPGGGSKRLCNTEPVGTACDGSKQSNKNSTENNELPHSGAGKSQSLITCTPSVAMRSSAESERGESHK